MVSIGDRLRAQRQALGLNQTEFGSIGGVTKKTQMLYEAGDRQPDAAYLAAIAAAGADMFYIVTGQQLGGQSQSQSQAGVLSTDVREAIRMVADELAGQRKHVSGAQFVALIERALRYLQQGRALEQAQPSGAKHDVEP